MQKYSAYVDIAKNALSESESVAVGVRGFTGETKYEFRRLNKSAPNNVVDFFSNIYERQQDSSEDQIELTFLLDTPLSVSVSKKIEDITNRLKTTNYIYYLDAYIHQNVDWGEDRVILREDTNLLENTDFNIDGHRIFDMTTSYNEFLKSMVETKIAEVTSREIDLEGYH
jgi:hypothetical protein